VIDVVRSPEAPASLAAGTSWSGDDVRQALREDFSGKCYLCEGPLERSWQIEHLRPRAAFPDLAYTWSNLYPACAICNNRRLRWGRRGLFVDGQHKPWPAAGMLDPTGGDGIELRLLQWFEPAHEVGDIEVNFAPRDAGDAPAVNTAEELRHLHGGEREDAKQLRGFIRGREQQVLERLVLLQSSHGAERVRLLTQLRTLLAPTAPYASLLRERIRRVFRGKHLVVELGLG
jgi:hypothetical protein